MTLRQEVKATLQSNLDLVRRVPLFARLTEEQAQLIAKRVVKRRFKGGEMVVERGAQIRCLFILLTGRARVFVSNDRRREIVFAHLQPGDFFGEMSLIDNEPHSATVRVEFASDVLVLDREGLAQCLPESPSLAYTLMHGLVSRLRQANRQITSLALMDVHGRVAHCLLDAAEMIDDMLIVRRKVSRQDIARLIGASREMVSRVMTTLEARGLIRTQVDGSVVINGQLARDVG